jgi:hypothetical protein
MKGRYMLLQAQNSRHILPLLLVWQPPRHADETRRSCPGDMGDLIFMVTSIAISADTAHNPRKHNFNSGFIQAIKRTQTQRHQVS